MGMASSLSVLSMMAILSCFVAAVLQSGVLRIDVSQIFRAISDAIHHRSWAFAFHTKTVLHVAVNARSFSVYSVANNLQLQPHPPTTT